MNTTDIAPAALTVKGFLAAYPISHSELYRQLAAGNIRSRKVGRTTLIDAVEARRWWNSLPQGQYYAAKAA